MDQSNYTLYSSSIAGFLGVYLRRKMFEKLQKITAHEQIDTILDVGVTSSQKNIFDNYFEAWFPNKEKITALSDQDASFLELKYPGLKFVRGDGKRLNFPDNSFDLVISSATIEHVGSSTNQKIFIHELLRVSKKFVFITTPNKYFPIELHTYLPILHWLPKSLHRKILRTLKLDFFADEKNLNLLSKSELKSLYPLGKIFDIYLFGWKSNMILFIEKSDKSSSNPLFNL